MYHGKAGKCKKKRDFFLRGRERGAIHIIYIGEWEENACAM